MPEYSEAVKQRAKELWEGGASYPDVAQQLDIPRWMTIRDWRKRYEWKRDALGLTQDMLEIWDEISEKALGHLLTGKPLSMTEALKVYEKAEKQKMMIKKQQGDRERSPETVLDVINGTK